MNFKFKKKEQVYFEEEGHKYTDGKGQQYTSVTTVLKNYYPPFEGDYYSTYKAVKDTLENLGPNVWWKYKSQAGGWKEVVGFFAKNKKKLDKVVLERIAVRKQYYLDLWEAERIYSADLGTKQHNILENLLLKSPKIKLANNSVADVSPADLLSIQGFDQGASTVHPELLLWNKQHMIAGQADRVDRQKMQVHIKDYKTCKEIEFEAFMGQTMLGPLKELPNTNYSKFTVQLSTYGWMLEQIGYEVIGCTMNHIDRHTGKHIKDYPLAYRPDLVEAMLEDFSSRRAV